MRLSALFALTLVSFAVAQQDPGVSNLACPSFGRRQVFELTEVTTVSLLDNQDSDSLCLLTLEEDGGYIPVARSYGKGWKRSGGKFASVLPPVSCTDQAQDQVCEITLPPGNSYVLHRRPAPTYTDRHLAARFLESATFGPTRSNIDLVQRIGFANFVRREMGRPATSHREYYRRRLNPSWHLHQIDYQAHLNPCARNSYWTRYFLTIKDLLQPIQVRQVEDRVEISVNGHVRSMPPRLRLKRQELAEGTYRMCGAIYGTLTGSFRLRPANATRPCQPVNRQDLLIQFPDDFVPENAVDGDAENLDNTTAWQNLTENTGVPIFRNDQKWVNSRCSVLAKHEIKGPPVFVRTNDGHWLQHDPRVNVLRNDPEDPLSDGGYGNLRLNRTARCSNVPRNAWNEHGCVMSTREACRPGDDSREDENDPVAAARNRDNRSGLMVCGSPGEVSNNWSFGDHLLDIFSINDARARQLQIPEDVLDTTPPFLLRRQRTRVWSDIVLSGNDQLRQRVAWALFQVFALPSSVIRNQNRYTEIFLQYYDIFVRNAFGNYRDILREITYNPLMAESLSYANSKSLGLLFARTGDKIFPDENFSRELMQLFTIGLVQLNQDGTPKLDTEKNTIRSYSSEDIENFARAWTGFILQQPRANMESSGQPNRIDPMTIDPVARDRFPKTDLSGGYIGDGYPLCEDAPNFSFLLRGSKFRLLGTSPLPETVDDDPDWALNDSTKRIELAAGTTGLYEVLCGSAEATCTPQSVVILPESLRCDGESTPNAAECLVDTIRVVKVADVYFEYIRSPCVTFSFFNGGRMLRPETMSGQHVCANPRLAVGSSGCCTQNMQSRFQMAQPVCLYGGERVRFDTASRRCDVEGKSICNFRRYLPTDSCPHIGYTWTPATCETMIKVNRQGQVAIVHGLNETLVSKFVSNESVSYFRVYWEDDYPTVDNDCGSSGDCFLQLDETCLCSTEVSEMTVFSSLPTSKSDVSDNLFVGSIDPHDLGEYDDEKVGDVTVYTKGGVIDDKTVFAVDLNGHLAFYRNVASTVTVKNTTMRFRNTPQFNSPIPSEFDTIEAYHETDAVLDHFFFHENTAPFVAYRLIQRFGTSNPSPEYVLVVATAFRSGIFEFERRTFGNGVYGDMAATVAAILLYDEARLALFDADPSRGALREPIIKVLSFMRAMEFESFVPLVHLDRMSQKIGQMAYEQPTVFSFFRPEFSPSGIASDATLVAPESQIMSSGRIVGLLNGMFSLVKEGLRECNGGFGYFGCTKSGQLTLTLTPNNTSTREDAMDELVTLLTAGRLGDSKTDLILRAIQSESDPVTAFQLALQLVATTPEFHTTNSVYASVDTKEPLPDEPQVNSSSDGRYKAVIHLALRGGMDSYNMLVPHSDCALYEDYKNIRSTIALGKDEMMRIRAVGQPCSSFGVHRSLSGLADLYNASELAFIANVGVLTKPVNKTNYEQTRTQLFAHNAMQDEIDALDPLNDVVGTGTLGRMSDMLQGRGYRVVRTAIESSSLNLGGINGTVSPIYTLDQDGIDQVDLSSAVTKEFIEELNGGLSGNSTGVLGEVWSSHLVRSLNQSEALHFILQTSIETSVTFSDTDLSQRFELIAKLIQSREEREADRDFFFVTMDGYDNHNEVPLTLASRFDELNAAVDELVAEMKAQGMWDDVVIVQTSDFGRTLTPNTSGGSDHGWGGNAWVTGGSVKGGQILGSYPGSFQSDGPLNLGRGRGRLIPTTPWDSPFAAIAEWTGINDEREMDFVLPNRGNFDTLFAQSELFDN